MGRVYNQIAGSSLERLAGLSDGVFAFAMTLLVLDIAIPLPKGIHTEAQLWTALQSTLPSFIPYFMSFMTLGIFWNGQQTQLNAWSRTDRDLTWIYIAFLCAVTLVPLTTKFLDAFVWSRIALLAYWFNILLLGAVLYWSLQNGKRKGYLKAEMADFFTLGKRRIVWAQALYAVGALLCVVNTSWSIGFILICQLIYAIAPRIPPLTRM